MATSDGFTRGIITSVTRSSRKVCILHPLIAIAIATRTLLLIIKTLEGTRSSLGRYNGHRDAGYQMSVPHFNAAATTF